MKKNPFDDLNKHREENKIGGLSKTTYMQHRDRRLTEVRPNYT